MKVWSINTAITSCDWRVVSCLHRASRHSALPDVPFFSPSLLIGECERTREWASHGGMCYHTSYRCITFNQHLLDPCDTQTHPHAQTHTWTLSQVASAELRHCLLVMTCEIHLGRLVVGVKFTFWERKSRLFFKNEKKLISQMMINWWNQTILTAK